MSTTIKVKKPVSESHRAKLLVNVAKARDARVVKAAHRLEEKSENELLLAEIIEDRKRGKKVAPVLEPIPIPDENTEDDETDSETEDETEEDETDDDAEFVLTRKAPPPQIQKKAPPQKPKAQKKSKIIEQMAAEIEALKKKKHSKVNVYVNQPEQKMSEKTKICLLDL
jgi:hypothetical protein